MESVNEELELVSFLEDGGYESDASMIQRVIKRAIDARNKAVTGTKQNDLEAIISELSQCQTNMRQFGFEEDIPGLNVLQQLIDTLSRIKHLQDHEESQFKQLEDMEKERLELQRKIAEYEAKEQEDARTGAGRDKKQEEVTPNPQFPESPKPY